MSTFRKFAVALIAVALLQTAAIAYMVFDHQRAIESQRRITLKTIPVDPRDFFRGDYVILDYQAARVPMTEQVKRTFNLDRVRRIPRKKAVWVELEKRAGAWTPVAMSPGKVTEQATDNRIRLAGRTARSAKASDKAVAVDYGINRFFVPEGKGRDLEKAIRNQKVEVEIAVSDTGDAIIRKLLVDGEVKYTVSLFD